jgi:hypothetical protein
MALKINELETKNDSFKRKTIGDLQLVNENFVSILIIKKMVKLQ